MIMRMFVCMLTNIAMCMTMLFEIIHFRIIHPNFISSTIKFIHMNQESYVKTTIYERLFICQPLMKQIFVYEWWTFSNNS